MSKRSRWQGRRNMEFGRLSGLYSNMRNLINPIENPLGTLTRSEKARVMDAMAILMKLTMQEAPEREKAWLECNE